jgi:hypothetical protein
MRCTQKNPFARGLIGLFFPQFRDVNRDLGPVEAQVSVSIEDEIQFHEHSYELVTWNFFQAKKISTPLDLLAVDRDKNHVNI